MTINHMRDYGQTLLAFWTNKNVPKKFNTLLRNILMITIWVDNLIIMIGQKISITMFLSDMNSTCTKIKKLGIK